MKQRTGKRLLSTLLVLVMMVGVLPSAAFAARTVKRPGSQPPSRPSIRISEVNCSLPDAVDGEAPDTTVTVPEGAPYTASFSPNWPTWMSGDSLSSCEPMTDPVFKGGSHYGYCIAFYPASGYIFTDDVHVTFDNREVRGPVGSGTDKNGNKYLYAWDFVVASAPPEKPAEAKPVSLDLELYLINSYGDPVSSLKDYSPAALDVDHDASPYTSSRIVGWYEGEEYGSASQISEYGVFEPDTYYWACVRFDPKPGYKITSGDRCVMAHSDAKTASMPNEDGFCFVSYRFMFPSEKPVEPVKPEKPAVPQFQDVKPADWFYPFVQWAVENKITAGTSTNPPLFSPHDTCVNSQIITFIWNSQGQPKPHIKNPFTDVKETDWFYQPALWAYENGLVYGEKFNPNQPCTRASTVLYLWRFAGKPEASDSYFKDVDPKADYARAVDWAVFSGITKGTGNGMFSPDLICTRSQIVTFIYNNFAKK